MPLKLSLAFYFIDMHYTGYVQINSFDMQVINCSVRERVKSVESPNGVNLQRMIPKQHPILRPSTADTLPKNNCSDSPVT